MPSKESGIRVRVAHALRTGHEDQYFFAPNLWRGMKGAGFDILHSEQGSTAAVYAQALLERNLFSRRTKTCFFTWINWEWSRRWPWTAIEHYNLRHSHGAIGGNCAAVDLLRHHGFRGRTAVIPQLGVDPDEYVHSPNPALRRRLGLREIVVGFAGRLVEEKGVRLLLQAAARLGSNVSLLLVGSGPLEKEVAEACEREEPHLVHVSAVPHEQVREYLRAMDILVLPSQTTPAWREQFGHVLIEAMSCEVPVLGSSSAAIPEVIGDAGLIFPEGDVDGLSDRLSSLVHSPEERLRLGQLGRRRVLEHYTHERIAGQTLEFWKTL